MSVYTHVARHELDLLLANYAVGSLLNHEGINEGVINSNFFVATDSGQYVLTLFENLDSVDASQYLALMQFFAARGMPVPMPVVDRYGKTLTDINGKPAVLVRRLPGKSVIAPTPEQCASLGSVMGKLHRAGRDFPQQIHDGHGRQWQRDIAARIIPRLSTQEAALLQHELEFQNLYRLTDLPMGVIHADLFRDNVLFDTEAGNVELITGVLDWYDGCSKALLYDIAVAANDWCVDDRGQLQVEHVMALLNAYHKQRPLTAIERGAWPVLLRAAALRFWLSRLATFLYPRAGDNTSDKDPAGMVVILQDRITHHDEFHAIWVT